MNSEQDGFEPLPDEQAISVNDTTAQTDVLVENNELELEVDPKKVENVPTDTPNYTTVSGSPITEESKIARQVGGFTVPGSDAATIEKHRTDDAEPTDKEGAVAFWKHHFHLLQGMPHIYSANTPWNSGFDPNYSDALNSYQLAYAQDRKAKFTNEMIRGDGRLSMRPVKAISGGKRRMSGTKAVLAITAGMGLGTPVQVPLVDSGIRLVYETPEQEEFVALEERLGIEKGTLGRQTLGYIFSYSDLYMTEIIVDFLLGHIADCNVAGWQSEGVTNKQLLLELLLITDLQDMAVAMLAARYPSGHTLKQPCTSDATDCHNIAEGRLRFEHALWIDESRLTADQYKFMTHSIDHKHTPEEVTAYQQSLAKIKNTYILAGRTEGNAELVFNFTTPSIATFLAAGGAWINTTRQIINDSVRTINDELSVKRMLEKLILNNELKLFTCWIGSIVFRNVDTEAEILVEDPTTINAQVTKLDIDIDALRAVLNALWDFVGYASRSIVGIPQMVCKVCNRPQSDTAVGYPTLIPINVVNVFFTLLTPSVSPVQEITSSIQHLVS